MWLIISVFFFVDWSSHHWDPEEDLACGLQGIVRRQPPRSVSSFLAIPFLFIYVSLLNIILQGLIVSSRKESLQHFKQPWAHEHKPVKDLIGAVNVRDELIFKLLDSDRESLCSLFVETFSNRQSSQPFSLEHPVWVRLSQKKLSRPWLPTTRFLLVLTLCFFRKQGIYAIFLMLVLVLAYRNRWFLLSQTLLLKLSVLLNRLTHGPRYNIVSYDIWMWFMSSLLIIQQNYNLVFMLLLESNHILCLKKGSCNLWKWKPIWSCCVRWQNLLAWPGSCYFNNFFSLNFVHLTILELTSYFHYPT